MKEKLYVNSEFESLFKDKSLKEFITNYFNYCAPATYYDEECTKVQCGWNRRRSVSDLLSIYVTYNPEKNNLDLLDIIIELPKLKFYLDENYYSLHLIFESIENYKQIIEREIFRRKKEKIEFIPCIRYCSSPEKVVIFSGKSFNINRLKNGGEIRICREYGSINITGKDGLSINDCLEILELKQ